MVSSYVDSIAPDQPLQPHIRIRGDITSLYNKILCYMIREDKGQGQHVRIHREMCTYIRRFSLFGPFQKYIRAVYSESYTVHFSVKYGPNDLFISGQIRLRDRGA